MRNAMLRALTVTMGFLLTACVSVDRRALTETIDKDSVRKISGDFSNHATYGSRDALFVSVNLAVLFDVHAGSATHVRVVMSGPDTLTLKITWYSSLGEILAEKSFGPDSGMTIAPDGAIDLPLGGGWSAGHGAWGYQSGNVRLFVNADGDLATIQSERAAGGLEMIPIGVYSRHLVIFPRKHDL